MMKLNKFAGTMVFFVLFLVFTVDAEEFDYNEGDYSKLPTPVDWTKVPPNRITEVPVEKLEYSSLGVEQRKEMSSKQITANFAHIENLATDVAPERAIEAIEQKFGVRVVSLGKKAGITQDLAHSTYGLYTGELAENPPGKFDFSGKDNTWKIQVEDDGRITVLEPNTIKEESVTNHDYFTVKEETTFVLDDKKSIQIKGITFHKKHSYVRQGEEGKVGDYDIPKQNNHVEVYFFNPTEEQTKGKNYLAVYDGGLKIGTTKDGKVEVVPKPGNKLFWMVKYDYGPPAKFAPSNDYMNLKVSGGDNIEVKDRAKEGKTPLIEHDNGGGVTRIETGRNMIIEVDKGVLKTKPASPLSGTSGPIDMRNSVAFELAVFDPASNEVKGKVWTSSSNAYLTFSRDQLLSDRSPPWMRVSNSIRENMIKTVDDLQLEYPHITFVAPTGQPGYTGITAAMAQTVHQWLQDNPGAEEFIKEFSFDTGDDTKLGDKLEAKPQTSGGIVGFKIELKDVWAGKTLTLGERTLDGAGDSPPPDVLDLGLSTSIVEKATHVEKDYAEQRQASDSPITEGDVTYSAASFFASVSNYEKESGKTLGLGYGTSDDIINNVKELIASGKAPEPLKQAYERLMTARQPKDVDTLIGSEGIKKQTFRVSQALRKQAEKILSSQADPDNRVSLTEWKEAGEHGYKDEEEALAASITKQTGLHPLLLTTADPNVLIPAFRTLSPEEVKEAARKMPAVQQLAQLEVDLMDSVTTPASSGLGVKSEDRYNAVMGSECSTEGACGPCKLYQLSTKCNP